MDNRHTVDDRTDDYINHEEHEAIVDHQETEEDDDPEEPRTQQALLENEADATDAAEHVEGCFDRRA